MVPSYLCAIPILARRPLISICILAYPIYHDPRNVSILSIPISLHTNLHLPSEPRHIPRHDSIPRIQTDTLSTPCVPRTLTNTSAQPLPDAQGEEFDEDGAPHQLMVATLPLPLPLPVITTPFLKLNVEPGASA